MSQERTIHPSLLQRNHRGDGRGGTFVDCYGSGVNHVTDNRFVYWGRMKLIEEGTAIDEIWETRQFSGGVVKKITGDPI
ncbi:MAG: hypothetical protein IPM59_13325 [Chloracidobacterium sp.]|nr:hypothetical protein [Chloracidobacterium sp.]